MKHLLKSCLVSAGLLLGATAANAGLIEHKLELNQFVEYGVRNAYSYTHNVSLNPAFEAGAIVSGQLSIELFDTDNVSFGESVAAFFTGVNPETDGPDLATVIVEGLDGDTGSFITTVDGLWTANLGPAAIGALNLDGMLNVIVGGFAGLDDLNIGTSTLTLVTQDVPAPATLALFGLGLAGLGAVRRRRAAA